MSRGHHPWCRLGVHDLLFHGHGLFERAQPSFGVPGFELHFTFQDQFGQGHDFMGLLVAQPAGIAFFEGLLGLGKGVSFFSCAINLIGVGKSHASSVVVQAAADGGPLGGGRFGKNFVPKAKAHQHVPFAGQDYIRDTFNGAGAHVGIIDNEVMMGTSGGPEHDDLNIWGVGWDNTGQGASNNPGGHGTHVAGSILGRGVADSRFEGSAPGVGNTSTSRFFHGRLFNSSGTYVGPYTTLFDALASGYTDGSGNFSPRPDIVNHSWSSNYFGAEVGTEQEAIDSDEKVWDGQAYVWSAGNGGTGQTIGAQPSAKNSLTVANAETFEDSPGDNLAGDLRNSSSRGPTGDNRMKPDITAPGAYIISPDANNMPSGYIVNSGTSMKSMPSSLTALNR